MQPVVDRIAAKLPTWKAGWLAMAKSVLGAIPIHQLLVLAPSKKILKLIVKIERGFHRVGSVWPAPSPSVAWASTTWSGLACPFDCSGSG
jgi:hypothetical protein